MLSYKPAFPAPLSAPRYARFSMLQFCIFCSYVSHFIPVRQRFKSALPLLNVVHAIPVLLLYKPALPLTSVHAACLCFSQSHTSSDTRYATTPQVMITTDMRQATETLSRVNTVFNCRTDAPRSSRISPTGRMATARTSGTRAKLIIQPEAHSPPLLTTQHQAQTTMEVPVMLHTEDQTLVTQLTPTGMTAVILMVVHHHLRTHLLDTANNPPLYQHHHSSPSHSFPHNHNVAVPFCLCVQYSVVIVSHHILNFLPHHTATFSRNKCFTCITPYLQCT